MALKINGNETDLGEVSDRPLLWILRDELGMTGTKFGCGVGACGACTVMVDGEPVRSCQTWGSDVEDADVTTIEGLKGDVATAVVDAWRALDVVQCGYCQSGQIVQAVGLLSNNPAPSDSEIDNAMDGNVCRCGTYTRVRAAIHRAAETLKG